ncbi:MAG TPA: DNA polymerase III subunit gamma/tau [Bacteroidales bacterium]|nr:DNA polymerase III subunit gamma/tau [Bacteroidales bacterium]
MENFIVSARKYRPVKFDMVVGQESITSTLKNAIRTNHLAQAYLFCGPRGVGKTTCARILAKTINCQNLTDNTEACGKCESCQAFDSSRSYNIHELDAASNNKVDDIRTLTDQVKILPQVGRYSVYIIDEVHMLSTSAFNAFLKTLEEPPPHAVFILATTEKQKIIPTILSRCQIFDFHRITIDDIVKRLMYVADKESIEAEQEALQIIAQKSEGSMRDALSILDQIVSYKGKSITYADVIKNLNVLDYEYYLKATDAFLSGDVLSALLLFNDILEKGFDGHNFIAGLSSHFRNLLICKDEATLKLVEAGSAIREKYREQTLRCPLNFLYKGLEILNFADIYYKASKNQKLHVELALIRLATINTEKQKQENIDTTKKEKPEDKILEKKKERRVEIKTVNTDSGQTPKPESEPETAKSFSIKDRLKKKDDISLPDKVDENSEEYSSDNQQIDEQEFGEEELMDAWKSFGDTLKSGNPRMSSIIKAMKPGIEDETNIVLELSNKAQKDYFDQKYKKDVIDHLKKQLLNSKIQFRTRVSEKTENSTPYTDEEKYRHMADKNTSLDKLRNEFGLEYD